MASQAPLWNRIGRALSGVVLLLFFMPFFGVSCNSVDIITIAGSDMVGGCKPGGMIAQKGGLDKITDNGSDDKVDKAAMGPLGKDGSVDVEPLAIAAFAMALAGFALSWLRKRQALLAGCVVAVVGLGCMAGLYVQITGRLDDVTEGMTSKKKLGETGDAIVGAARDSVLGELERKTDIDAGAHGLLAHRDGVPRQRGAHRHGPAPVAAEWRRSSTRADGRDASAGLTNRGLLRDLARRDVTAPASRAAAGVVVGDRLRIG